jgi:hypothetical protein
MMRTFPRIVAQQSVLVLRIHFSDLKRHSLQGCKALQLEKNLTFRSKYKPCKKQNKIIFSCGLCAHHSLVRGFDVSRNVLSCSPHDGGSMSLPDYTA